jgi:hypothetical protein
MAAHKLRFLARNKSVPRGQITTTARRGVKWYDRAAVGDRLDLIETESGEKFGEAVCVGAQVVPLHEVIAKVQISHSYPEMVRSGKNPHLHLRESLVAAYGGDLRDRDLFTVLHFLVLND